MKKTIKMIPGVSKADLKLGNRLAKRYPKNSAVAKLLRGESIF